MTKGHDTKIDILEKALDLSSELGLEGLSIGILAKRVKMSKSGLYAHFDSKEDLQLQVLNAAADRFIGVVISQAIKEPRGLPRIKKLFETWLDWTKDELSGGCLFIAAASEFDDRSGPVRDQLVSHLNNVIGAIARAATFSIEEGHFRRDLDVDQFAFEFWSIIQGYHLFTRLIRRKNAREQAIRAFNDLIQNAISL